MLKRSTINALYSRSIEDSVRISYLEHQLAEYKKGHASQVEEIDFLALELRKRSPEGVHQLQDIVYELHNQNLKLQSDCASCRSAVVSIKEFTDKTAASVAVASAVAD